MVSIDESSPTCQMELRAVGSNLTKALSHSVRVEVFELLMAEPASPQEIAKALGHEVKCISYHVSVLHELGCLLPTGTRPTEGGCSEKIYEADPIAVAEYMLKKLPASPSGSSAILRRIIEEGIAALEADTLDMPKSRLSCFTAAFDREGFEKVSTILGKTIAAVVQTYRESHARLDRGETEPVYATIITGWFESPTERDMLGEPTT